MKVYLSSTLNDLGLERQAVKDALGGECTVVESYVADERSVRESCLADVAGCDLYVGIVGLRYGFVPPGEAYSITELEYREARARGTPALVFVKDEDEIKPRFHDAVTNENPRERVEAFRKALTSGTDNASRASLFKSPEDLKAHVLKAYLRYSQRHEAPRAKPIEGRPYPGLRAFLPTESDRFFGRDAEIESLLERLLARGERFLALIGASGSGKSSLAYAGLIPRLTASAVNEGTRWFAVSFSPRQLGDDPFLALAAALAGTFPDAGWRAAELARRLRDQPEDIAAVAREALGAAASSAQILLFADQFEEVFAVKVDVDAGAAVFTLLAAAAACPLLRVVIAMRSDFYTRWPQDEAAVALLRAGHFPVAMPGLVALEKMIVGPARAAGLSFQPPPLVQRILDETGTAPGALALAEFALAQLYDRRQGQALTEAAYVAIGGVAGAIEGLAEDAVKSAEKALSQAGQVLDGADWSRLFVAIASLEERGQEMVVVRRRATASELTGAAGVLAQHLVEKRLLVSSAGTADQPALLEVGHEAVFSHWSRFRIWYEAYADALALRRQAERAAADWHRASCAQALRWGWERQRPALLALAALGNPSPARDAAFTDEGIDAWRVLAPELPEPLRAFLEPEPLRLLDELAQPGTTHQRREEIGLRLNQMGDPRRGVGLGADGLPDIDWVDVAEGEVSLGIDEETRSAADAKRGRKRGTAPPSTIAVKPFKLARYPITWAQYRAFVESPDGFSQARWWQGLACPDEHRAAAGPERWAFGNYPVIHVSWFDATAFCRWLSERLGEPVRLPTEWEWQCAALSTEGGEYPWPGAWDPARANSAESGIGRTVAVGLYPSGRSRWELDDMAGNVWEWCCNEHATLSTGPGGEASRVLRGGSWDYAGRSLRVASRNVFHPVLRNYFIGFRVCRASPI